MPSRRAAALLALAAALACAPPAAATPPLPGERIQAGVTAGGLPLWGLTIDQAAAKLRGAYGERLERGVVTVEAADLTWRLSARAARVRFDAERSARRALYAGRETLGARPVDVELAVSLSRRAVDRFAGRVDRRLHRRPRDARLRISVTRVRLVGSRRGRDIDGRALARDVAEALRDPRVERVLRPRLRHPKPKVTADALRRDAATVITIHRASFTLRLFKNRRVVKRYKVAVGLPAYPTPRGRFRIQSKQVNPVWTAPNSPWAGELAGTRVAGGSAANPLKARWMGIVGGVGIHGTGQGYSIGTRASHGCIRMHVPDVIELFSRVRVGAPVLIA